MTIRIVQELPLTDVQSAAMQSWWALQRKPGDVPYPSEGGDLDLPDKWDVGKFSQSKIDAAADLVKASVPVLWPATPNLLPVPWPVADPTPSIRELDFGHLTTGSVKLKDLMASQNWVQVDRLLWHIQNPGQRAHNNPFTLMPVVMQTDDGPVIVDGHHSLASLLYMGADKVPVLLLPAPPQPKEVSP